MKGLVGGLLLAIGVLTAAAGALLMLVYNPNIGSGANLGMALVYGRIPLVVGLLPASGGWRVLRRGST